MLRVDTVDLVQFEDMLRVDVVNWERFEDMLRVDTVNRDVKRWNQRIVSTFGSWRWRNEEEDGELESRMTLDLLPFIYLGLPTTCGQVPVDYTAGPPQHASNPSMREDRSQHHIEPQPHF